MKTAPAVEARRSPSRVDGQIFKQGLLGSLANLASKQEEVNRLNVFPVPDGDTGTNMLLTLQSAVDDIKESEAREVGKVAALAAHGSLMGARGNSGVILSQIFRGFAKNVQGKAELDADELAGAFEEAAQVAYRAVIKPTEGTILTVARDAARAARAESSNEGASVSTVLRAAARGAAEAVDRTPGQLAILREAGVVDAGGYGLQIMLEGFLKTLQEGDLEAAQAAVAERRIPALNAAQKALALPEEGWGYCTEFILEGDGLKVESIRETIASMGNSVLVVGEPELVKVHVHTEEPAAIVSYAAGLGRITKLKVDDMSQQHRLILEESSHEAGPPVMTAPQHPNGIGLVAVVAGDGLEDIFRGLGVDAIVEGGQTMNPATQDMLQAVERVPYESIILLPNNGNVILAASQVTKLTKKQIRLVETHSVPQGIAAAVAFNGERDMDENLEAMQDAAAQVQTIEVTHAVRDSKSNGMRVKKGDVIALTNDKLSIVGSDYGDVVSRAIGNVGPDGFELVTVYRGADTSETEVDKVTAAIKATYPDLQVELQHGGQQHYPFILSLE